MTEGAISTGKMLLSADIRLTRERISVLVASHRVPKTFFIVDANYTRTYPDIRLGTTTAMLGNQAFGDNSHTAEFPL